MEQMREDNFKLYGFATGNYQCECSTCDNMFEGDKRATMCLPCAVEKAEKLAHESLEVDKGMEINIEMLESIISEDFNPCKVPINKDGKYSVGECEEIDKLLTNSSNGFEKEIPYSVCRAIEDYIRFPRSLSLHMDLVSRCYHSNLFKYKFSDNPRP